MKPFFTANVQHKMKGDVNTSHLTGQEVRIHNSCCVVTLSVFWCERGHRSSVFVVYLLLYLYLYCKYVAHAVHILCEKRKKWICKFSAQKMFFWFCGDIQMSNTLNNFLSAKLCVLNLTHNIRIKLSSCLQKSITLNTSDSFEQQPRRHISLMRK